MNLTEPLNSPLETGLRVLFLLAGAFPDRYGLEALVHLDYMLLHTGQIDGPPSIHPEIPGSIGELAIKPEKVKGGVDAMMRAGLIAADLTPDGFAFRATENGYSFVSVLDAPYAKTLKARAAWLQDAVQSGQIELPSGNRRSLVEYLERTGMGSEAE